jgi:hypothetical protein
MRTLAARLDAHLVLNQSHAILAGKRFPIYRGELRFERSGHWNQKHTEEIVSIGKARCRVVYDLGVEDEPHLFALASGILTHNSKPNPMPESVKDRCTKAHEYVFLLSKSERYFFDSEAIKEPAAEPGRKRGDAIGHTQRKLAGRPIDRKAEQAETRNRRSVWTITPKPYRGAHFAVMPPDLAELCILAGTSKRGCCPACGKPWERVVDKANPKGRRDRGGPNDGPRDAGIWSGRAGTREYTTVGWQPGCKCSAGLPVPCTVLDPFGGSGTTGEVAASEGRKAILIELNPEYVTLANKRGGLFVHSN